MEDYLGGTGVFASPEELKDLKNLARQGWQPGEIMIVTSVVQGITKDLKTIDGAKLCHQLALAHGLPEIDGLYGITQEGEFVRFEEYELGDK